jgi:hypothetical protein
MISAQDKIMHVANKLGLTSLKDMQASTGAVYDVDTELSGTIFSQAARHINPGITNINENQFEVNEALLVETIAFYVDNGGSTFNVQNFQRIYGSNAVIVFDLIIGNKRVLKDTPVFAAGSPYTFANVGQSTFVDATENERSYFIPRHQIFMEGAGILIPPQVQWYVQYTVYNVVTGAVIAPTDTTRIGCYLFGTKVLLNFNTSI